MKKHYKFLIQKSLKTIPVRPGRNVAVIIEVATMNYRLNIMGINTFEEFNQRLNEEILKRSSKQGELEHAFNLNYIDPTAFSIGPLSIKWYGIIIAVESLLVIS